MQNLFRIALLSLVLGAARVPSWAQPQALPDPLFSQNFEDGELGPWSPMGPKARLSVTREPMHVKEGTASVRFDYEIAKDQMNTMLLAAQGPLPLMGFVKSISFWIKTDYAAPIVLVLQEQGGGRYLYIFSTPKDVWQQVVAEPSECVLSEDPDDPKDPNNQLDLERVEAVALADMSQIFAQNEDLLKLLNVRSGPHTIYLDDLSVSTKTAVGEAKQRDDAISLDDFKYPQPSWLGTGNVALSVVADEGMKGRALKASYRHSPDKFVALVRRVPRGRLEGTRWLSLGLASIKPVTLAVQVEERGGGKYNAVFKVPGDVRPFEAKLEWKNFTPADDSRDDNNRLDLDQINQLLILDATGFLELADGPNTLWLSHLFSGPVTK
jgi:hypothetical protein